MQGTPDIAQLRHLLFGKDYDALLALKSQIENTEQYSASVASVITEALAQRESQDGTISTVLAPTIEHALTHAIKSNPKHIADVLYPVMGPAIRKSIQQALNEALAHFNQLLEQSLSLRSWKWRFDAWRTGQSYAQIALLRTLIYQVEQVFLIHRETGLLLHHIVSENVISKDPAIISGMFTAIQDFIQDSFAVEGDSNLDTLRLGELTVLIEHGPQAVLALVVRGCVPSELRTLLAETSETVHQQYAPILKAYQGQNADFIGIDPLLHDCLVKKHKIKEKRQPWLAYLLLITIACALSWWAYQYQQTQAQLAEEALQAKQAIIEQLQQQQTQQAALQASLQTLLDKQQQQTAQQAKQITDNANTIATLTKQIESTTHTFEKAKATITPDQPDIIALSKQIVALLQAAQQADNILQIMILGNADTSGTDDINQHIAQQRAENLRDALIKSGIPAFVLVAYGSNQPGIPATLQKNERSIHYRVSLY
ncbi:OmpA family protein [Thiothrix lacustris]|uniref:OmpA family protein n=1 Tax=Thiothrix lacustris TaxID=525917 RepID=UPI0027E45865|nr:OmpA family protein [Thiothrix lacustris]WMP18910.1 OmpA family protein [Thiothrix lacustris]